MKKSHLLTTALLTAIFALPKVSMALPISYTDLWDMSNGNTIDSTSGALHYSSGYKSDIRKMFGNDYYAGTLAGPLLFKDYMSPGYQGGSVQPGYKHYVEWHTLSDITLRSFNLVASNEGMDRRAFDYFELFTGDGHGNWTSIYNLQIDSYADHNGPTYTASNFLELAVDLTPVVAQYFRAEFRQARWTDSRAVGPRVWELDGYDTFLNGTTEKTIPEPATLALMGLGLAGLGFKQKKRV